MSQAAANEGQNQNDQQDGKHRVAPLSGASAPPAQHDAIWLPTRESRDQARFSANSGCSSVSQSVSLSARVALALDDTDSQSLRATLIRAAGSLSRYLRTKKPNSVCSFKCGAMRGARAACSAGYADQCVPACSWCTVWYPASNTSQFIQRLTKFREWSSSDEWSQSTCCK